ncbi:MAG TPA: TlpA disulfide reductase family protein [Streptosporangiaceae bacterium]|nr:TlpA disulfide reductase family protein [Streptosporangiaceae bacterium]
MPKPKRRVVVLAATVCAGVLAVVLLVTAFGGSGSGNVTYIGGNTNAVLYTTGHQPKAPDFTGTTLTGSRLGLATYRGSVVVLNFWGSWCPPCRAEATTLAFVAQQYQSAGVRFLGVDVRDNTPGALDFLHSHNITYPSVSDPDDTITLDFSSVVPISSTPSTLVIDKTGHVAGAVFGEVSYQELTTILGKVTARND